MLRKFLCSLLLLASGYFVRAQQVSVNGNVFKFSTIADYEAFAENETLQGTLPSLAGGSSTLTTLDEASGGIEDTVYAEFLTRVLNTDHIMEVGSFLLKIDMENNRGLAISTTEPNAYQTLLNNVLSAANLFVFDGDDDLAIEVLEQVEAGQLSASTYRNYIETNRACSGALRKKGTEFRVWSTRPEANTDCNNGLRAYAKDSKIVYQKFIFYFSLQTKIKSLQGCTYSNFILVPTYTTNLGIRATGKYRKRCGQEVLINFDQGTVDREFNYRPYQSIRSLSHYLFTSTLSIYHDPGAGRPATDNTTLEISSGY